MNSIVNPLRRLSSGPVFVQASKIKAWVRQALELDEAVVVSVNEIACAQPGCPPEETVILVLRAGRAMKLSIHKALADVIEADVIEASGKGENLQPSSSTASRSTSRYNDSIV